MLAGRSGPNPFVESSCAFQQIGMRLMR